MKRKLGGMFGRSPKASLGIEERSSRRKKKMFEIIFSSLVAMLVFVFNGNFILTVTVFAVTYFASFLIFWFMNSLKLTARIRKIEHIFPDFLQSVSSNLRAGMTVDRAMVLSSRPEFDPLDKEILQVGKDISTGKPVELALKNMSKRINSEFFCF